MNRENSTLEVNQENSGQEDEVLDCTVKLKRLRDEQQLRAKYKGEDITSGIDWAAQLSDEQITEEIEKTEKELAELNKKSSH